MSLRSARQLRDKVLRLEDVAMEQVDTVLESLADSLRSIDPVAPPDSALITEIGVAFSSLQSIGASHMRAVMQESVRSVTSSLRGVEATLEKKYDGLARAVVDRLEPQELIGQYQDGMLQAISALSVVTLKEMKRQQELNRLQDPERDVERWVSSSLLRRPGRPGRGVIPSLRTPLHAIMVNWSFAMVNGHRQVVVQLANREMELVDRSGAEGSGSRP